MKITKEQLKQIIKEEISNVLNEAWPKGVRKKGKDEAPKIVHPANKTMPGEQWYEDDENPYGKRAKEGRREFAAQRRAELGLDESYFDVAPASRDPEGRAVSDAGPVEENGLNEVSSLKSGEMAGGGIEWDILDNGQICFERYSEDEYSSSNVCVPLEELKQIIGSEVQEARRQRETPAQKRERSKRERRDAELRSQGKPEWQSGQPGVTTTSLKDLKKMMNQNK